MLRGSSTRPREMYSLAGDLALIYLLGEKLSPRAVLTASGKRHLWIRDVEVRSDLLTLYHHA